jgi:hypothetical protein
VAFWNRTQIDKATPLLPAGAVTTQITPEHLAGIANQAYNIGVSTPLPRQPFLSGIPFGPSNPLIPSAINPVGADGQPEPRRWEYPVAWNIFVTEQRAVPWSVLRVAADQIDLIRRCVEVLKSKIAGLDWDITFSEAASEQVAAEFGGDHVRAMQKAREKYSEDITRVRTFLQVPDRINGLSFKDWLSMALEEILVLDALAIYPHPDMKGDLHSLEILDGSTIKPLLDDRGMRPAPPFPAYQQILYGFPRGEFTATSDDPEQDGIFSADELIYTIRNRRTFTPYGYSPVERSLPLADIYIKRQQWLRAEFTDGVMSELMLIPDMTENWTPDLLRAYENIINDDLAGQTEQRHRARILPPGLTPVNNSGFSEKFSAQFDEYLIKGICGHFGVLPTEIGYSDGGALGGAGQQFGEAESGSAIGTTPLIKWLEQQMSDICYKFLGMPRELVFQFDGGRTTETTADAQRRDVEIKGGQRTLNEARAEMGLPLLEAAEADVPMMFTSSGLMFITPDGVVNPASMPSPMFAAPEAPAGEIAGAEPLVNTPQEDTAASDTQEIKAFVKWAKKGNCDRDFEFKTVDPVYASALNRAAKDNDIDFIKSLTEVALKKG